MAATIATRVAPVPCQPRSLVPRRGFAKRWFLDFHVRLSFPVRGPASVFCFSLLPSLTVFGFGTSGVFRRFKPGVLQIKKKARMPLSHRARVIRAVRGDVPAFDVLRRWQPKVYLDALRPANKLYVSESAKVGAKVFEALCNTNVPIMSVAKMLRSARDGQC